MTCGKIERDCTVSREEAPALTNIMIEAEAMPMRLNSRKRKKKFAWSPTMKYVPRSSNKELIAVAITSLHCLAKNIGKTE
mmetsp:Transcript_31833/g.81035  ORF Transcript_31833/g.81035 Transcript_31833/m.81035 type:complete len:80 (+) Transcript_31833:435-674(+)